ncbi:MAG: SMP-30/gluconolactonase/LRE family protein [Bryobacteraceae bacterium]
MARTHLSRSFPVASAMALLAFLATPADAQVSALTYDAQTRGPVPIPPSERSLQTVNAEPWFKVSNQGIILEGPAFERNGDLVFCDVSGMRVLRVTPDKQLTTVVTLDGMSPGGLAIQNDGPIFIAAMNLAKRTGSILQVKPDGTGIRTIVPTPDGYMPNDLVLDSEGGFYFSDFRGISTEPNGGAYYVAPDLKTITPVLLHLAMANGIALSPDEKQLWITEFSRNLLRRVELANSISITAIGTAIPYHFTGPAPDSMRVDSDGNLYVAIYGQGRVLVFNKNGIPIGQVLLPGRDEGHNLQSTSMAIKPGTDDLYIVTNDANGGEGATIFHAKVFAEALPLYPRREK